MQVRAKRMGWYGSVRQREGVVFVLADEKHFSERWMERIEAKAPVVEPQVAAPSRKAKSKEAPAKSKGDPVI
jgi:hypothetical protein